jgi:nitrite reductase/ring-hydroxylating ferredoxin subunit
MHNGWFQVAYERELEESLTPAAIGHTQIILIRSEQSIRAFDAFCPHRGAHLAYGGQLDGEVVVCPFHGRHIRLGLDGDDPYCLREYPVLGYGGMVFVQLGVGQDTGLGELLEDLSKEWLFVPGFTMRAIVPHELVIENAFDNTHFRPIHHISNEPVFQVKASRGGEFGVEGTFELPASPWQRGNSASVPFVAEAFSPGVVVSRLDGDYPYCVITAATPDADGGCVIRLSLAVPRGGEPSDPDLCKYLLKQSQAGLEQDAVIWTHMAPGNSAHYAREDRPVIEFRKFCRRFTSAGIPSADSAQDAPR